MKPSRPDRVHHAQTLRDAPAGVDTIELACIDIGCGPLTEFQAAQTLGTLAAFQTSDYLAGQGAACSEPVTNPTPCTAAT